MSLLGIDIGTTGCKSVVFSLNGEQLAKSYRDYKIISEKEGCAEWDSEKIWCNVKDTIREVALKTKSNPIQALSVSSLGEAMVLVSKEGQILGNSILGSDTRGIEFVRKIRRKFGEFYIYKQTGNFPGTFYSLPKISWLKQHHPELYNNTGYFLTWADFVCFMLGGKAITNFCLAGRTLLFDINKCEWSDELLDFLELDRNKLAAPVKSCTMLGYVRADIAKDINLSGEVAVISGGHDQCCAILGSGIESGSRTAMYGMGTFMCVATVFPQMPDIGSFYIDKMHIEHHVEFGSFISFIYNQSGGALIDWFLKTFHQYGNDSNISSFISYESMFAEIPDSLNDIIVIPRFGATGPPDFQCESNGCIFGLSLNHTRGDILRALLEGISFYILDCFEKLHYIFDGIDNIVVTGGGSASREWLQITANVLNKTIVRNRETEAGALGAAILAGIGSNMFDSFGGAISAMVHKEFNIIPDQSKRYFYKEKFKRYKLLAK
jgi:xylulokinase